MGLTVNFLGKDLNELGLVLEYPKADYRVIKYTGNVIDPEGVIKIENRDRAFSADNSKSILKGMNWRGERIVVSDTGGDIIDGKVTSGKVVGNEFRISTQSEMARMFQANISYSVVGTDPASACLGILKSLGMDNFIDENSFNNSKAFYQNNNIAVSVIISRKDAINLSSAISRIAIMGVASIYQQNNKIYFNVHQENERIPRYSIDSTNIIDDPKIIKSDEVNIINGYALGHLLDGDVPAKSGTNLDIQKTWQADYSTGNYIINDFNSAVFLGGLRVLRDGISKDVVGLTVARKSMPFELDKTYKVTIEKLGWLGRYAKLTRLTSDNKVHKCELEEISKTNYDDYDFGFNHGSFNEGSFNDADYEG